MRFATLLCLLVMSGCASTPRYVIFFPERSAQLDSEGRGVVAQVAARASERPASTVQVIGYTDSAGSPQADVVLSQQRAQTVADALQANGVAPSRLVRAGRGQTNTDPGIASRRVEITIGP